MSTVAVVGLGAMGSVFARRLLAAGHDVIVWNRTQAKAAPLIEAGALASDSPADAAGRAEAVITMVSDPSALRAVTEGTDGIAAGAKPATTLIEMSTVGPAAIERLAAALPSGTDLLDAPVLGSTGEAEAGTLRVFAGGPRELVARWRSVLETFGEVHHVGEVGSGAAAKLVANATLFTVLAGLGETLALADRLGLSREAAFEVLATTPLGAQAERRRAAIESDEYPVRFPLGLARKDAGLIAESTDFPVLAAARSWLEAASSAGWDERDYSALLAYILARAGAARSDQE